MLSAFVLIIYLIVGVTFEISNPIYLRAFDVLVVLFIIEFVLEFAWVVILLGGF
jgi:hypothetical protein